jgi:hypothetical protein
MNSRAHRRNKRTKINLIDESPDTRLFATKQTVGRRVIKRYHIVLKREPRFSLERSIENNCDFIRLTRDNTLVGLIKNGELERHEDVEKLFFLGKLDLKPIENYNRTEIARSLHDSANSDGSTPEDESHSCTSSSLFHSPSPPDSGTSL